MPPTDQHMAIVSAICAFIVFLFPALIKSLRPSLPGKLLTHLTLTGTHCDFCLCKPLTTAAKVLQAVTNGTDTCYVPQNIKFYGSDTLHDRQSISRLEDYRSRLRRLPFQAKCLVVSSGCQLIVTVYTIIVSVKKVLCNTGEA